MQNRIHAPRLMFLGTLFALTGILLSLAVVCVNFPRQRQICADWSAPLDFPPLTYGPSDIIFDKKAVADYLHNQDCASFTHIAPQAASPVEKLIIQRVLPNGHLRAFCCTHGQLETYFPPTISESIHNWHEPAGRIFFGYMLVASILLLLSFHPYSLSNVCSLNDRVLGLNSAWLRQYVPATGLLLLACVPTVPVEFFDIDFEWQTVVANLIMFQIHMIGAVGAFMGYALAEIWALGVLPDWLDPKHNEQEDASDKLFQTLLREGRQLELRLTAVSVILTGCGIFSVGYTLVMFQSVVKMGPFWLMVVRVVTYAAETAATLGLAMSLMIIWAYSPERELMPSLLRKGGVKDALLGNYEAVASS